MDQMGVLAIWRLPQGIWRSQKAVSSTLRMQKDLSHWVGSLESVGFWILDLPTQEALCHPATNQAAAAF